MPCGYIYFSNNDYDAFAEAYRKMLETVGGVCWGTYISDANEAEGFKHLPDHFQELAKARLRELESLHAIHKASHKPNTAL